MEFFDLRPGISVSDSQPEIQTVQSNVLLTLPLALAETVGLSGVQKVRVQFGADGTTVALRIKADDQGAWPLRARRTKGQIYIPEIQPTGKVERQPIPFSEADGAIVFTLPSPWELANPLAVRRQPGRRSAK